MNIVTITTTSTFPHTWVMLASLLENQLAPCKIHILHPASAAPAIQRIKTLAHPALAELQLVQINSQNDIPDLDASTDLSKSPDASLLAAFLPPTAHPALFLSGDMLITDDITAYCHSCSHTVPLITYPDLVSLPAFQKHEQEHETPAVIHYKNHKPWQGDSLHTPSDLVWWNYAAKTPFYHHFLEKFCRESMMGETVAAYASNLQHEQAQLKTVIRQYETILDKTGIPHD